MVILILIRKKKRFLKSHSKLNLQQGEYFLLILIFSYGMEEFICLLNKLQKMFLTLILTCALKLEKYGF